MPIAAYAKVVEEAPADAAPGNSPAVQLHGLVGIPDGLQIIRGERGGPSNQALAVGVGLAEDLLDKGADRILARLSRAVPAIVAPERV